MKNLQFALELDVGTTTSPGMRLVDSEWCFSTCPYTRDDLLRSTTTGAGFLDLVSSWRILRWVLRISGRQRR